MGYTVNLNMFIYEMRYAVNLNVYIQNAIHSKPKYLYEKCDTQ